MVGSKMNRENQTFPPHNHGRRSSRAPASPEFEFWMVRNPSFPQPNLLSADELIVDGVLRPLNLLRRHNASNPPESAPPMTHPPSIHTPSKRWKDIFWRTEKTNATKKQEEKEKEKKKLGKSVSASGSTELNINLWPFSRSRSAGNVGTRTKVFTSGSAARKVNSAPCSRSNSAGESKSKKWPGSPSRTGVHLGRNSPVWQVRRGGSNSRNFEARNPERGTRKEVLDSRRSKVAGNGINSKTRVLNLNVPICTGYTNPLNCRSNETTVIGGKRGGAASFTCVNAAGSSVGNVPGGSNLFNLRSLFAKKVY